MNADVALSVFVAAMDLLVASVAMYFGQRGRDDDLG